MRRIYWVILSGAVFVGGAFFGARAGAAASNQDRIDVIAHVGAAGAPAVQLDAETHWRRNYLYVDRGTAGVAVFDVTNPARPKPVSQLEIPREEAGASVRAIVGTAAVVATGPEATKEQTVTILSFANPEHPAVVRQFARVSAMLRDPSRGLIYLSNPDGLWILQAKAADDAELEREYGHYVRYNP